MKNRLLTLSAVSLLAIFCVAFTVKNYEPGDRSKGGFANNECFNKLLKNLAGMNAMICIPDQKLAKGLENGLQAVKPKNATINLVSYIAVSPVNSNDPCLKKARATFDELQMIVYVEKIHQNKLAGFNLMKIEAPSFRILNATIKVGDKLQVLIDDTTAGFTQVELKP